ncbi:hypothetical protein K443DRAFT_13644 [Laccaria amethystina LaAM-08-1]|uniref:Uncharacterized protein n=1 Tax=Laccaria amethystina LaAM-08-1 TaxID=1095629 RepID=A0A0C9WI61_9AGAR|nr:hypothetical protein K443DRAFT_13644 [Laccaria amethystina LaAM-08-1]
MDLLRLLSDASPTPLYQPSWATPVDDVPLTNSDFPGSTLSPPRWIFPPVHESPQRQLSQFQPPSPSPQLVHATPPLPSPQADFSSLPAPGPTPPASIVQRTSAKPSSTVTLKEGFVDTGGATTFASRNPLKDIQAPRFRIRESQSDATKLGRAEKKLRRDEKAGTLREGVDGIMKSRDAAIKDLAQELDLTEKAPRQLPWNILISYRK